MCNPKTSNIVSSSHLDCGRPEHINSTYAHKKRCIQKKKLNKNNQQKTHTNIIPLIIIHVPSVLFTPAQCRLLFQKINGRPLRHQQLPIINSQVNVPPGFSQHLLPLSRSRRLETAAIVCDLILHIFEKSRLQKVKI